MLASIAHIKNPDFVLNVAMSFRGPSYVDEEAAIPQCSSEMPSQEWHSSRGTYVETALRCPRSRRGLKIVIWYFPSIVTNFREVALELAQISVAHSRWGPRIRPIIEWDVDYLEALIRSRRCGMVDGFVLECSPNVGCSNCCRVAL